MTSFVDYIAQAEHNEKLADGLAKGTPIYIDWALVIAFYSVVSLANAAMEFNSIDTTSKPQGVSYHAFRKDFLEKKISQDAHIIYKNLMDLTVSIRYLSDYLGGSKNGIPSHSFFEPEDVPQYIGDIEEFRKELIKNKIPVSKSTSP